ALPVRRGEDLMIHPRIRPDGPDRLMIQLTRVDMTSRSLQLVLLNSIGDVVHEIALETARLFEVVDDGELLLAPYTLDRRPVVHVASRDGLLEDSLTFSAPEQLLGFVDGEPTPV